MNMMKMMKQAQELQAKAGKLQAELAARQYSAEAAGGQIKAVATGEGQLVSIKIDPALVKEGEELTALDDREKLKDLVNRMLAARIALGASDTAGELATIVKA